MQAYEYYAELLSDGHLSIPDDIKQKIYPSKKFRVMLFFEDEDQAWNSLTASEFLKGYSAGDAIYDKI